MTLRGRTNQHVEDWRNQRAAPRTAKPVAEPDTTDGIDLLVIILFIGFVCMLAGYAFGRR